MCFKYKIAAIICAVCCLSGMINWNVITALAAWDGYTETEEASVVSLIDFNNVSDIVSAGGVHSGKHTRDGYRYSAHWNNHLVNNDFWVKSFSSGVPTDWSDYTSLNMWIYSEKATNASIKCIIYSTSVSYYSANIKVDWEGFKKITVKFSEAVANRTPSWSEIIQVRLVGNGNWSVVGNKDTDLYIASMYIKKSNKTDFISSFYDEEVTEQTYRDLTDSIAVYGGGSNAATQTGQSPLGYTTGWRENTVMVPLKIFADYFGAEVNEDSESYGVTHSESTISGSLSEKNFTVNDADKSWNVQPYTENSMTFVPGEQAAKELGISAYSDGKLLVMGTETAVESMHRTEHLGVNEENEIASYLAYHDALDINSYSPEDCSAVKQNWVRSIVGSEEINDLSDPDIAEKINSITYDAQFAADNLIKESGSKELFMNMVSTASTHMSQAYTNIYRMACAYACPGSTLYHDEALKEDICYALEWMYNNRYGKNTAKCEIWKFTGFNNWWDWDIGAPRRLVPTLILMEDALTSEQIKKYLSYFDKRNPEPKLTASNFTIIAQCVIGSALLQNDYKRVIETQVALEKTYLYVDDNKRMTDSQLDSARAGYTPLKGAGFFTDGSYVFHTLHAMNGTYGPEHYSALCTFENLFDGTKFEMKTPFRDNVPEIYFNSFDPLIFGTTFHRTVMGRQQESGNYASGLSMLMQAFRTAQCFDEEQRDRIYSAVKAVVMENPDLPYYSKLSIEGIKRLKEVMADDAIQPRSDFKINKVYYNMDKIAHQRGEWSLGVSMSSSRIFNYECINSANMKGWYLGDGRTEYYLKGSDTNASQLYWNSIDPYRLPGITADTQQRKAVSIAQGNEYLSSKDFVGGVSLDSQYGTAAMWLESYHNDKDFGKTSGSYGGMAPAHKNDLTAKKSYFMFDDEVVCLGAAVNAKDNNNAEVLTIVDNLMAENTKNASEDVNQSVPYKIISAKASATPEAENVAEGTIDGSYETKWAGELDAEIVWDLGEIKTLGFIELSMLNGSKRKQFFSLQTSADGITWKDVFDGESSGTKETNEYFSLDGTDGRYVKFINKGNSVDGSTWVSITECRIYPPNADGSIGFKEPEIYGDDPIIIDGVRAEITGEDYLLKDALWANAYGKCGYVFPKEESENPGELKARWTKGESSHFELWFSHGENPTNGSYAYILLPGKSAEYTKEYAEKGSAVVLANNEKIQAVYDKELGIKGIVFWEAGTFGDITVSGPCIVMYSETENGLRISASDPTQKLKELIITVNNQKLAASETDECAKCTSAAGKTVITINTENSAGRTFEAVFAK